MNAFTQPPFPTNPSVGERYGNWVWNGVRWVCSTSQGVMVNTLVFTASGPYQPSPGLVSVTVEAVGGGGAGGAVMGLVAAQSGGAGGGGAGGYSRATLAAALVAGGVSVTIGAGGVPDTSPTGAPGSQTSFGAFCIANGGGGGNPTNNGEWGGGGLGGTPGTGTFASPGQPGEHGALTSAATDGQSSGAGAASFFGGGAIGVAQGGAAVPGLAALANTGAGGSGACSSYFAMTAPVLGGAGGSGVCIVTEYCFQDGSTEGEDCLTPTVNVNAKVAVTKVPWRPSGKPCPPLDECGPGYPYVEHFEDD